MKVLLLLLLGFAGCDPITRTIAPGDLVGVEDPVALAALAYADRALADAEAERARADSETASARAESETAAQRVEAAEADVHATEAELSAAETGRDAARASAARDLLALRRGVVAEAGAFAEWKRRAQALAEARTKEAEALVDVRRAEQQIARLDAVGEATADRSEFTNQLADAQRRHENAGERVDRWILDAREAERAWQRTTVLAPVNGT